MAVEIIGGNSTANKPNVENNNLQVNMPGFRSNGIEAGGGVANAGSTAFFSENDTGENTGLRKVRSPETDDDFRLRVAHDNMYDFENFNYASQNTGKHQYNYVSLTSAMTVSGYQTNASSLTSANIANVFNTWAEFPVFLNQTLVVEQTLAFSALPVTNTTLYFGPMRRGAANPWTPTDGAYFRLSSAGLFAVTNYGGTETAVQCTKNNGGAAWTYTANDFNKYLVQITNNYATFWINNELVAEIACPANQPTLTKSQTLHWGVIHQIGGGAASGAFQSLCADYKVYIRGMQQAESAGNIGNRAFGSYQGLSGGTMGALIAGTVTTGTLVKPTAAVPANASLTANLPNSLGGRIYEQLTSGLAANTDGIFALYTVPAASQTSPGRRLKINGIKLSGMVSTVVAGGPAYTEWYIAFGSTNDSLNTSDSASLTNNTLKAPRRVMLPELTTNMAAAQAAGTLLTQPAYSVTFKNPIYVNPGERIALVGNKTITTAITSGVLSFTYQFDYSWE